MRCKISNEIKNNEIDFYREKSKIREKYVSWETFYPEYLKAPYYKYLSHFSCYNECNKQLKILELCCGMGEFSFDIARITQGEVLAVDISKESIDICNQHLLETKQNNLEFKVADIEQLQLPENNFDIICMSGSLSYLNLDIFLENVKKWLKPEGRLIIVDTYGYSPFFNLKRRLNYLFGKTTKQTVLGIPKDDTINQIRNCFNQREINFYGTFAFLGPFLKYLIGDKRTAQIVNFLDKIFPILNKWAFKFVLVAQKIKKSNQ